MIGDVLEEAINDVESYQYRYPKHYVAVSTDLYHLLTTMKALRDKLQSAPPMTGPEFQCERCGRDGGELYPCGQLDVITNAVQTAHVCLLCYRNVTRGKMP